MKRRDESIQAASAVFAENRARVREKRQALDERAKLLESEKGKNVSLKAPRVPSPGEDSVQDEKD
jgi:hypothetical protein